MLLMDSHLEGKFSTEEATVVVNLASKCLQYEPRERPDTKDLVTTLAPLHTKPDVSIPSLIEEWNMLFLYLEIETLMLEMPCPIFLYHLRTLPNIPLSLK